MPLTPWVNYLAGFGAILLTFLAGAEIDVKVIRRNFGSTVAIGAVGFFAPYLGVFAWAHFVSGWPWAQAQIAGIALSTTSVAVVYAVMVETGFNNTEIRRQEPHGADRHRRADITADDPGVDFGPGKKRQEDRAEPGEIVDPRG